MMSPEIQVFEFTEIVGDHEVCCDLGTRNRGGSACVRPARWVMWTKDHGCGTYARLACEPCKEARLMNRIAVQCMHCDHITIDACEAYSRIEAL